MVGQVDKGKKLVIEVKKVQCPKSRRTGFSFDTFTFDAVGEYLSTDFYHGSCGGFCAA